MKIDLSNLSNRKFQTGKQAKKMEEKLAKKSQGVNLTKAAGTLDQIDEGRGPSLMDLHSKKRESGKGERKERKAFDREKVNRSSQKNI